MKRLFTLLLLIASYFSYGQKMIWTSLNGGDNSNGAVVGFDLSSQQTNVISSLDGNFFNSYLINIDLDLVNEDSWNSNGVIIGQDGNLYGTSALINANATVESTGGIYKIDPVTKKATLLHSFTGNNMWNYTITRKSLSSFGDDLRNPVYGLIEASQGVFYGLALDGGKYGLGGIWKYDTNTSTYTKIYDFDALASGGIGRNPNSPLIIGKNGDLYGVVELTGPFGSGNDVGHLYKIDISNDQVSYVHDLDLSVSGWAITGVSDQIYYDSAADKIIGTKEKFTGANYGGGLYSYDFNTNLVENLSFIDINSLETIGSNANGVAPFSYNGHYYFLCRNGGVNGNGTIVKYNQSNGNLTKLHDFTHQPNGTGLTVIGSKIYGTNGTLSDGEPGYWVFDADTETFSTLITSTANNTPGHLFEHSFAINNNILFGSSVWGGTSNSGSIFAHSLQSPFETTIVVDKTSVQGRGLVGEMALTSDNKTAYALIEAGGELVVNNESSEHGGIAKVDLENSTVAYDSDLSNFIEFSNIRTYFYNKPVISSNGNIHLVRRFMTTSGGNFIWKKIDPSNPTGETITTLDIPIGSSPLEYEPEKLMLVNNKTIYTYDEASATLTPHVTSILDTDGVLQGNLIKATDGNIYGTTTSRDFSDATMKTAIFKIDPSTLAITIVQLFDDEIDELNNGLTEYNGLLYGSTVSGGNNGDGYLFSFDPSLNTVVIRKHFDYDVDGGAFLGEWTVYNNELYAVSYTGGQNGYGTFVKYTPSNTTFSVLENLTMENGRAYRSSPIFWDDSSILGNNQLNFESISIYPNPVRSSFTIELNDIQDVKIYNSSGSLLRTIKKSQKINVEDLEKGLYLLRIKTKDKIYNSKFIKE
jgi:hypothetical protein